MTECEPSGGGQAQWVPDQTPTCRQITVGPTPPPVGGKYIMLTGGVSIFQKKRCVIMKDSAQSQGVLAFRDAQNIVGRTIFDKDFQLEKL